MSNESTKKNERKTQSDFERLVRLPNKKTCGACKEQFDKAYELAEHLKTCKLAATGKRVIEACNSELFEDEKAT